MVTPPLPLLPQSRNIVQPQMTTAESPFLAKLTKADLPLF